MIVIRPAMTTDCDADLFKDVVFLVEADNFATFTLWRDHHGDPRPGAVVVRSWEQETRGVSVTLDWAGGLIKRPICIDISWAKLNGKRVLFYEGCSQLVDHKLIGDWLKKYTLETIRWDDGTRWAHCNAMNFHLCLDAIGVLQDHRRLLDAHHP